jgi:hypothetical protein
MIWIIIFMPECEFEWYYLENSYFRISLRVSSFPNRKFSNIFPYQPTIFLGKDTMPVEFPPLESYGEAIDGKKWTSHLSQAIGIYLELSSLN